MKKKKILFESIWDSNKVDRLKGRKREAEGLLVDIDRAIRKATAEDNTEAIAELNARKQKLLDFINDAEQEINQDKNEIANINPKEDVTTQKDQQDKEPDDDEANSTEDDNTSDNNDDNMTQPEESDFKDSPNNDTNINDESKKELSTEDRDNTEDTADKIEMSDGTEETDDSDASLEDVPIKDPFEFPENQIEQNSKVKKEPREATIEDIKKQLNSLSPARREMAKKAIQDILAKRKTAKTEGLIIKEAIEKNISEMNDDEWDTWVNSTLDKIKPFEKQLNIETEKDRQTRIQQIDTDLRSARTKRDIDQEDKYNYENSEEGKERQKQLKARKDAIAKYGNIKPLENFKLNFYNAIADQVQMAEDAVDTYSRFNRQYEEDPAIIIKGQRNEELPIDEIPSVDVYLDCSGSFSESDIKMEESLVSTIKPFVDRGEVILNIYYFARHLHNSYQAARREQVNGALPEIIDQINRKPKTKNVVFVSDNDENYSLYTIRGEKAKIEGCVWWIWKGTRGSNELMECIRGAQGNYQYMFN